ncbi:MAG: DUF2939 domain-containing protein [Paracoccaceae bacterium]
MRWLIALVGLSALGYGAWPYASLYQLSGGFRDGDAEVLEARIDWPAFRASVKADVEAAMLARIERLGDSGAAAIGRQAAANLAPRLASEFVERFVTSEQVAQLARRAGTEAEPVAETETAPSAPPATEEAPRTGAFGLVEGLAREAGVDAGRALDLARGAADASGLGDALAPGVELPEPTLPEGLVDAPLDAVAWAFFTGPTSFEIELQSPELGPGSARLTMALQDFGWKVIAIDLPETWLGDPAG